MRRERVDAIEYLADTRRIETCFSSRQTIIVSFTNLSDGDGTRRWEGEDITETAARHTGEKLERKSRSREIMEQGRAARARGSAKIPKEEKSTREAGEIKRIRGLLKSGSRAVCPLRLAGERDTRLDGRFSTARYLRERRRRRWRHGIYVLSVTARFAHSGYHFLGKITIPCSGTTFRESGNGGAATRRRKKKRLPPADKTSGTLTSTTVPRFVSISRGLK